MLIGEILSPGITSSLSSNRATPCCPRRHVALACRRSPPSQLPPRTRPCEPLRWLVCACDKKNPWALLSGTANGREAAHARRQRHRQSSVSPSACQWRSALLSSPTHRPALSPRLEPRLALPLTPLGLYKHLTPHRSHSTPPPPSARAPPRPHRGEPPPAPHRHPLSTP